MRCALCLLPIANALSMLSLTIHPAASAPSLELWMCKIREMSVGCIEMGTRLRIDYVSVFTKRTPGMHQLMAVEPHYCHEHPYLTIGLSMSPRTAPFALKIPTQSLLPIEFSSLRRLPESNCLLLDESSDYSPLRVANSLNLNLFSNV